MADHGRSQVFRKQPWVAWTLSFFALATLAIGTFNWGYAARDPAGLGSSAGRLIMDGLYCLVIVGLSATLLTLALRAARFRLDGEGIHEWRLTGMRVLPWSEVTRCYLLRDGGLRFIVLCRGEEQWRIPAAAFREPGQVFNFVDYHLPKAASRSADA